MILETALKNNKIRHNTTSVHCRVFEITEPLSHK